MWKLRGFGYATRYTTMTVCVIAAVAGTWAVRAVWHAQGALRDARDRTSAESTLRFTSRPLDSSLPAGLEFVGAPAVFSDAQVFEGHLFIAGPSGLAEYDNGELVKHYRAGAELPPAQVTALAVGLAGDSPAPELWIATAGEGLVAFDGRSFRQIRAEDAGYRKITALLSTSTGRILIGTEKSGVLAYDGHEMKPFHVSLADVPVTALAGDDADLWVGTLDRGLLHWKAGALESMVDSLPDHRVLSIAAVSEHDGETVYAGTGLGVSEIQNDKVTRTLAPGYFAQSLLVADGELWIGTLDEGMVSISLQASPAASPAREARSRASVCGDCSIRRILRVEGDVYALAEDSLWRGSEALIPRGDSEVAGSKNAVLADRNISALSMDASGRLWIGYFDHGLQVLRNSGVGERAPSERFNDDHLFCVNRIAHDATRGVSAVATANGLVMFDDSLTRRRVITHDDGLIANQITDVLLRPDGRTVVATPAGVSFIDPAGISSIYAFQGLVNNHVYALAADGARTLAGTLGGLSILDGPIVSASFTTANSTLRHNWITAIVRGPAASNASGSEPEWFVGTYGGGVLRMDSQGRWETFEDLRGVIDINSNAMIASDRAVYAGTLDRGLAIYDVASGRWHFSMLGLPSPNVTAVEVRGGIVYIGTDNGLVKIPESVVINP